MSGDSKSAAKFKIFQTKHTSVSWERRSEAGGNEGMDAVRVSGLEIGIGDWGLYCEAQLNSQSQANRERSRSTLGHPGHTSRCQSLNSGSRFHTLSFHFTSTHSVWFASSHPAVVHSLDKWSVINAALKGRPPLTPHPNTSHPFMLNDT